MCVDKTLPRVVVAPVDQVVLKNEEAVFQCQFRAKPPPVIQWIHDSEPVLNKSRSDTTLYTIHCYTTPGIEMC